MLNPQSLDGRVQYLTRRVTWSATRDCRRQRLKRRRPTPPSSPPRRPLHRFSATQQAGWVHKPLLLVLFIFECGSADVCWRRAPNDPMDGHSAFTIPPGFRSSGVPVTVKHRSL